MVQVVARPLLNSASTALENQREFFRDAVVDGVDRTGLRRARTRRHEAVFPEEAVAIQRKRFRPWRGADSTNYERVSDVGARQRCERIAVRRRAEALRRIASTRAKRLRPQIDHRVNQRVGVQQPERPLAEAAVDKPGATE